MTKRVFTASSVQNITTGNGHARCLFEKCYAECLKRIMQHITEKSSQLCSKNVVDVKLKKQIFAVERKAREIDRALWMLKPFRYAYRRTDIISLAFSIPSHSIPSCRISSYHSGPDEKVSYAGARFRNPCREKSTAEHTVQVDQTRAFPTSAMNRRGTYPLDRCLGTLAMTLG